MVEGEKLSAIILRMNNGFFFSKKKVLQSRSKQLLSSSAFEQGFQLAINVVKRQEF